MLQRGTVLVARFVYDLLDQPLEVTITLLPPLAVGVDKATVPWWQLGSHPPIGEDISQQD